MASPSENLVASLGILKKLQDAGRVAIRADDLTRTIASAWSKAASFRRS